ncbi:hypothetical protein PENTCL1PPCAC_11023, partial [Pristionchus entomophagus]
NRQLKARPEILPAMKPILFVLLLSCASAHSVVNENGEKGEFDVVIDKVHATPVSPYSMRLSWTPYTNSKLSVVYDVHVTRVNSDHACLLNTSHTSILVEGLYPGTAYSFSIRNPQLQFVLTWLLRVIVGYVFMVVSIGAVGGLLGKKELKQISLNMIIFAHDRLIRPFILSDIIVGILSGCVYLLYYV